MFRQKGPDDQGYSHDELHDEVEICPEGGACAEKTLYWEVDNTAKHRFRSHIYDFLMVGKRHRLNRYQASKLYAPSIRLKLTEAVFVSAMIMSRAAFY